MPATIELADLAAHQGQTVGQTAWRTITQEDVDDFARLTGDDQWIHVDRERAASGPFGTTIAHGYFTLSLSTIFLDEIVTVTGAEVVLNYGSDRVRYPAPTPAGSKVRATVDLGEVRSLDGGAQAVWRLTYEIDGGRKPVCVADIVYRYYTDLPARTGKGPAAGAEGG